MSAALAATLAWLAVVSGASADVTTIGQGICAQCQGVAADTTGLMYASDYTVHQVLQFSSTGALLSRAGTTGTGNGQFEGPAGLATDSADDLYVADPLRGDVQEFSSDGSFIQKFPASTPWAVTVDPSGNVYIAGDSGNIYKYSSAGALLSTWQSGVGGNPTFARVRGVAYDPANGDVYAVDFGDNEVIQFTSSGSFVSSWGTFGNSPGQLNDPYGLAIDQAGDVYISQPNLIGTNAPEIIQKFSGSGAYISSYTPPGQPEALSYEAPNLYVAESSNVARINLSTPIASLQASSTMTNPGQSVAFDGSQSSLPFGTITDYSWDLDGSGQYATDTGGTPTVVHTFTTPGTYKLGLRVTGSSGGVATASVNIDVPAQPTAAIAAPSAGGTYSEGQPVSTSFSCVEGAGGPGISGCVDSGGSRSGVGSLDTSAPGKHTYTVTATSGDGQMARNSLSYTVVAPPTATITNPSSGQSYTLGETVQTSFACQEATGGPGLTSCTDSNGQASPAGHLDTSTYGRHTYSVTATSSDGLKTTTTLSYAVAPAGVVGFIIDNGDYATNDPTVTLQPVWPLGTTDIFVSNDGGFGATGSARTVALSTSIPWKLQQTGNDRLPKTVYIRFVGAGIDTQNFTDNIILDETAPTLSSATLVGAPTSTASPARASRWFRLKVNAADRIVGLCAMQTSPKRRGGTVTHLRSCRRKGILHLAGSVRIRGPVRPRYARVQNSAGSWSRWLRVR